MLDRFSRSVRMSPYLVAVAVTDYTSLPAPDNSTVVWAPREDIAAGRGNLITAGTNARVTICTDRPGSAATSRPGPPPGPARHHRSTSVASHHTPTPTQTFWSLILYNVTHKNNTYKGMSHNGDKYYNLTMIEPNIGSCNLVILPQG